MELGHRVEYWGGPSGVPGGRPGWVGAGSGGRALLVALAVIAAPACSDGVASGSDTGPGDSAAAIDAAADSTPATDGGPVPDGMTPVDAGPPADGIPIPLTSVIEGSARDRVVVTFDRTIGLSHERGFTIRGGDELEVVAASAAGAVLTLQLSAEVEYLQNALTWSYDETEGAVLRLPELRLIYIENRVPEPLRSGATYFVSADGNSSNTGLTEDSPWSIDHAVAQVGPGDHVWVRAGRYAGVHVTLRTDGRPEERITFEGYRTSAAGVPDVVESLYWTQNADGALDPAELPLFDGGDETGSGFDISGLEYVTFRNLQFTRYQHAFHGNWEPANGAARPDTAVRYCLFERVVVTNVGGTGRGGAYTLLGEKDHNAYNTIRESAGQDSSMVGFMNSGHGCLTADSRSYGVRDNSAGEEAQDYYFTLKGTENVALRNLAHRVNHTVHDGHGYALRGERPSVTEYNLIQDNVAINLGGAYELRNETSAYNVIRDCVSSVDGAINGEGTSGLRIMGGSHHNLVEGHSARGVSKGILLMRNGESSVNSAGHDNLIRNSEFYGMPEYEGSGGNSLKHAILAYGSRLSGADMQPTLENNRIVGCTFHDFSFFLRLYPESGANGIRVSGNEFENCSISRGTYFKHPDTIAEGGFSFRSCNFFEASTGDGGFDPLVGTDGNISVDPQYTDGERYDFRLGPGSGLVDQGADAADLVFDFDGRERPQAGMNDIGAFER